MNDTCKEWIGNRDYVTFRVDTKIPYRLLSTDSNTYVPRDIIPPSQWNTLLVQSAHHKTITMQSSMNTTSLLKLPLQWHLVTEFLLFNLHHLNMFSAANMPPWVQQLYMDIQADIAPL